MMEVQMSGLRMVGCGRWLVLCVAALGATSAIYSESLSARAPESYAAVRLVKMDARAAGVRLIDSTFSQLERVLVWSKPGIIEVTDMGPVVPLAPRRWRQVEPHPYISQVLPGVEFYSVVGRQGRRGGFMGDANREWMMARRQGRLYKMPQDFNQLLYDYGMRFYKADVPKWTRLAALVWTMVNRDYLYGEVSDDWVTGDSTYWRLPAVPAVTFKSVEVETTRVQVYMNEQVRLVLNGTSVDLRLLAGEYWFGKPGDRRLGIVPVEIEDRQSGTLMMMGPIEEQSGPK
jgi:hypothetical protein